MHRVVFVLFLAACAGDAPKSEPTDSSGVTSTSSVTSPTGDAVGRCDYVNAFSQSDECKEYLGSGWTVDAATTDCTAPSPGSEPGAFLEGVTCDRESILGECIVGEGTPEHTVLVFPGEYGDSCDGLELGCTFAGGTFVPSPICEGATGGGGGGSTVFQQFEQICVPPIEGEPAGAGPDGEVCTWQAISGATEEGRYFADYADCSAVLTQRPYWGASASADTAPDDPRLSDPTWVAEYEWVTDQVEASACICCHSTTEAPDGEASGWYIEAGPIWTDTFDDDGMAMMAGWVDSSVFGAFEAEDNNGFSRERAGSPTTDEDRMIAFFEGELARRGLTRDDFVDTPPFGGPLYDQLEYVPDACADGLGVAADGTITWAGGDARYVYVLEADANPPGVPPNLDLPEGTVWRLDVDWTADPVASGLTYGDTLPDTWQRWPEDGSAPELMAGETYYLYVLADIYLPLTRCLFTAE